MPERIREIDEHMQEAIDKFDVDCKLTDKEWSDLDADVQDDLALLAEIGEAVCRVSSPSQAEDAETDLAWERMKVRMANNHQQDAQAKEEETKEEEVKEIEVKPIHAEEEKAKEVQLDKKKKENTKTKKLRIFYYSVASVVAALLLLFFITKPEEGEQGLRSMATLAQKANSSVSKENKKTDTAAAVAKSATKTNTTATVTCTAMARRSLGNASQLIMELQNQGYAVDGQVQRSSQPVQPGKLGKVVLPDGTEAYLYASSKLTYPSSFVGGTRDVVLEGEAYFKVTHDASHPFIIHTANATTRVLGTELDVRAFHGEPLHVALITGVAEVVGGNDVCRLKPGEGVTLQGANLFKQQEDMDVYAYALRGFIYADDAPLENVLTSLAHWYGMSVSYTDRKNASRRIHFYMRGSDSPERAAELLNSLGAFNVSVKGDYFVVN